MKVYCDVKDCGWWEALETPYEFKYHKSYAGWEGNKFTGTCSREEIAVSERKIATRDVAYNLAECRCRSDKGISGHLDFSKFPQGGHVDDGYKG